MISVTTQELLHLLATYGYLAVFVFVAIESIGIPFPGETMLLVAAIYAGTTHRLAIPLVIAAAALGAIVGDNLGFLIGREGGYRLLRRFGRYIRLDERKLKLGQYLFMKHGGKVVFFGRFIAVLRAWAAFLAGTNRMPWPSFLLFNALGGIVWATLYGLGGYFLGESIHRLTGPVGTISIVLATLVIIAFLVFIRRNEQRLEAEAERALPGPLDAYQMKTSRGQAPSHNNRLSAPSPAGVASTPHAKNEPQPVDRESKDQAEPELENKQGPAQGEQPTKPVAGE